MRLGILLAAPVLATVFAASAFAATTQTVTIVFTPKGGKACTMTLTDNAGILVGKGTPGCGSLDVGVAEGTGKTATAVVISGVSGKDPLGFFVDLTKNTYDEITTKDGKKVETATGTVKVTVK